jgi:hypothetical protein
MFSMSILASVIESAATHHGEQALRLPEPWLTLFSLGLLMATSILNPKTVAALCLSASVWVKQDGKWVTVVHSEAKAR